MTIQIPPGTIIDRIFLKVFGKRRGIIMPNHLDNTINQFGHHVIIKTKKESFLKALFKRKS